VDPLLPQDAQRIVASYLAVVERHTEADVYPCPVDDLPHPKDTIRAAFRTSVVALASAGQLTPELRDYLEVAYVSLADYTNQECATLLREYARAGEELAADHRMAREKLVTDAWQRLGEQSRLAGELARTIADEATRLRCEFRSWPALALA
jgi:hypothetical protein